MEVPVYYRCEKYEFFLDKCNARHLLIYPADYYMDTRPEESGGGRYMALINGIGCNGAVAGYSWSSKTRPFDNIVLCPEPLAQWESMKDFTIEQFSQLRLGPDSYNTMSLDGMMGIWGEGTMLHELTHGHYTFNRSNLITGTFFFLL